MDEICYAKNTEVIGVIGTTKLDQVDPERLEKWENRIKEFLQPTETGECHRLVTGGAPGADERGLELFEKHSRATVYLPYKNFNSENLKKYRHPANEFYDVGGNPLDYREAYASVWLLHPVPHKLKDVFSFHARNYMIAKEATILIALPELPFTKEVTMENLSGLFGGTLHTCRCGLHLGRKVEIF